MGPSFCSKITVLILLLLAGFLAGAQTRRIDSLKQEIAQSTTPERKLNSILALCAEKGSLNPDTLLKYASVAKAIAGQRGDSAYITQSYYYLAYNLVTRALVDSGLVIIDRQLNDLGHKAHTRSDSIDFLLLKARAFNNSGKAKKSLDLLFPLLSDAERRDDTLTQISAINLIVGAYVSLGQDRKALEWGYKALPLFPTHASLTYARQTAVTLSNLSLCYLHLYESEKNKGYLDSADRYNTLSIAQERQYQLLGGLAYNLGLSGTILGFAKKTKEGEAMLLESLKTYREIGNTFYLINAMSVLGNFYIISNQPQKGIAICKEGIELSKTARPNIYLYGNLAENYRLAGNYRMYGETLKKLVAIKDSLYKVNSAEAISDLQTRYEVQKKENTIILQKLDLTRKNNLLYASIALSCVVLIGAYILFAIRKKNQAMKLQDLQIAEKRKTLQAVLQAEENERNRIAADLHDGVAQKMVAAKLNLQTFESYFKGFNPSQQQTFDNISSLVEESCTEVRDLSHSMMPQAFFRSGLTEAVKNLLNKLGDRTLLVNFSAEGSLENVSDDTQIMIYRIIQECIQNVLKHAHATKLDIAIMAEKDALDITVEDNGRGFDATRIAHTGGIDPDAEGVGLKNIRSRVAFLNGELDISSRPGEGTLIALYIPLKQVSS